MKTHVILLEANDDVISVRDKMSWAKTERILLVYPRRSRILSRPLDLRLLQKHAVSLGAQLAIVSRLPEIRSIAGGLGVPVFNSSANGQRSVWTETELPERPKARRPQAELLRMRAQMHTGQSRWAGLTPVRLGLFSLAVLSILALLVVFFPSATIKFHPRETPQDLTLDLTASPAIRAINLAGSLPARTVTITVSGERSIPTTGTAMLPDQPAEGQVSFQNLTTGVIGIPAGTVVQTAADPVIRYETTIDGVLEGGVGKTIDLPVKALQAGTLGNLPAGALTAIEGELGVSLTATNAEPTAGGTDRPAAVPTASDRTSLRSLLMDDLRQKASLQAGQAIAAGDILFPDSFENAEILSEVYIPAEGQPGSRLTLSLQIQYRAQYAKLADVRLLASELMNGSLPEGFGASADPITITNIQEPVTDGEGAAHWQIQATRPIYAGFDPGQAGQMVRGMSKSRASQKLRQILSLDAAPVIKTTPAWWPWLPWLSFRIDLVVQ